MAIHFAQSAPKPGVRNDRTSEPSKPKSGGGRPKSANPKAVLNIRVDADVLARWKATGPGWQARINDMLAAGNV